MFLFTFYKNIESELRIHNFYYSLLFIILLICVSINNFNVSQFLYLSVIFVMKLNKERNMSNLWIFRTYTSFNHLSIPTYLLSFPCLFIYHKQFCFFLSFFLLCLFFTHSTTCIYLPFTLLSSRFSHLLHFLFHIDFTSSSPSLFLIHYCFISFLGQKA